MDIKDIVNRELVNLVNCESEPIHVPGSIQPHGFLLAFDASLQQLDYCSENISAFIHLSVPEALGKSFAVLFGEAAFNELNMYMARREEDLARPFLLQHRNEKFTVSVHRSNSHIICEGERLPDGSMDLPDLYNQTSRFVAMMEEANYLTELCAGIADETRSLTGYDRVMIYRFDEEYNGEVIAESKREDLESFAGQKYPHTDIPVQARELYIKNQLRMIADVSYTPVPLFTINTGADKTNTSLDLSLSVLRSVSPIHIEYLRNMGVGATLTISLLQDKKLWGLIACHHYSSKILPHYIRLSALLQGHFLTSQIKVREAAQDFENTQRSESVLGKLLELLFKSDSFTIEHANDPLIPELTLSGGVIIFDNGVLYRNGITPDEEKSLSLIELLMEKFGRQHYFSDSVSKDFPQLESIADVASGIIYYPLSAFTDDCIIWLRPERVQTIKWAGNPYEKDDSLSRLTPRKSFELWVEQVRYKSIAWKKNELSAAANFAYALEKHNSLRISRLQEERYRLLSDELKAANTELANVNWISTHDLKEPLRKIQIFASMVLDGEHEALNEKVKYSVLRMRVAAQRMQTLIEDILSYSKTGSMEKIFVMMPLADVVKEAVEELHEEAEEKKAVIEIGDLPALSVINFQVRQLFVNLISNAIKFSEPQKNPLIQISSEIISGSKIDNAKAKSTQYYHQITIRDNGIGFEPQYAKVIFDVFRRLHSTEQYQGTGIGLAICKKIMENHDGFIEAESEPGKGTVMQLYFPQN